MIRILYITSNFRRCGPVNQLYNLVTRLDKKQFEAVILSLSPEGEDSMKNRFDETCIPIESLYLGRLQGLIRGKKLFRKHLNKLHPNIIHTQGFRPDAMVSGLRMTPVVSTIRMDPGMDYPMKYGKVFGKWMKHKHLSVIRKNKNAVLCSESLQQLFKEVYGIDRHCIPNGVDTAEFHPASAGVKARLRKKHQIPDNHFVFIYTGSLIQRKNVQSLLHAFSRLHTNALLLIAGSGPMMEELIREASGSKNIRFLGQRSDVKNLLQLSDAFISPSLSEGLPNTVLEAMACGLPVLLSNIAQHREIFSEKQDEYFFPPKDVDLMSSKMQEIMKARPEAEEMLGIIRNKYSADIMAQQYQELYKKILS
ncbi:MAG: glycosyltransferase family 4 protein [Bacteroidota bacterium]|nr:glycosyltransferase family 4 protein [Bacteroidota bacterium]